MINDMNEYIKKHIPFDTPISKKKYNRIMNKMVKKLGKNLYKSLNKEDLDIISAKSKEFGKDKIDIISKFQESKDFWTNSIPNEEGDV